MCNTATGSRSSACAKTHTNSEHASMLLIKLCNCRFIIVAIYVLNFEHEFIREYWRHIVIELFLLAVLHCSRSIIFSCSTAVDSKDHHCPDCPKKWSWYSAKYNPQLFHCLAWDNSYLNRVTNRHFNYTSYAMTQLIWYTNVWLFQVAS